VGRGVRVHTSTINMSMIAPLVAAVLGGLPKMVTPSVHPPPKGPAKTPPQQNRLPVVDDPIIWTSTDMSYWSFYTENRDGDWFLEPAHQRNVIKEDEWQSDIIKTNYLYGNVPDAYFHPVLQPDGSMRGESLDGKQRCTAVIRFFNSEIKYDGMKFSEMHAVDQKKMKKLKTCMKVSSRTLTPEEIKYFFRKLQQSDKTTTGEFLNSDTSKNRTACLDILKIKDISESFTKLEKKKAGPDRQNKLEIISRLFNCFIDSTSENYCYPDKEELTDWFHDFPYTTEQFEQFETLFKTTIHWLANGGSRLSNPLSPSVYIPVFLMFRHSPGLAGKFSAYMATKGPKKFSFASWEGCSPFALRAGGKGHYNRYMAITENVQ